MNDAILQALQKKWSIPTAEDVAHVPAGEPAADHTVEPDEDEFSCEWVGMNIVGRKSEAPEADAARLEYLMRHYPIKPYLNEGGGSGIEHPHDYDWQRANDHIVKEFSELWFTKAGDIIIEKYGHRMKVNPRPRESQKK